MAKTHTRYSKSYRIAPLPVATPLYPDESITSWLVRASLNQGCSIATFNDYYWHDLDMWRIDVDKGFNHINPHIHTEMAILAQTPRENFDKQNLMNFAVKANTLVESNNLCNTWILPLLKRNFRSLLGYHYCPLCLQDNKNAYLKLNWRYSWYVYCLEHTISLEHKCSVCDTPYQPNLIKPDLNHLNRCHSCKNKLYDNYSTTLLLISNAYELQQTTLQVLEKNTSSIFGNVITVADWFALMRFYINLARQASKQKDNNYLYYRLFIELGIKTENLNSNQPDLLDSKTNLPFECLPINERIRFMNYANILIKIPLEQWITACQSVGASQNSFYLNRKREPVSKAFLPVHEALPTYSKKRTLKPTSPKPTSMKAVKKSWERLQRKLAIRIDHEQTRIRSKNPQSM